MHSKKASRRSLLTAIVFVLLMIVGGGCRPSWWIDPGYLPGVNDTAVEIIGGQDTIVINLPLRNGSQTLCTQGAGGSYSHTGNATRHDVDLDTPNNINDYLFAPIGGVAYVHDDRPHDDFGLHINIDLLDGTYIVIGHLSTIFIEDGQEVAVGQLLGYEGSTGDSTGDHVHIGRHRGNASADAIYGPSVEGLAIMSTDTNTGETGEFQTSQMVCGLSGGHYYRSHLPVELWHPNGSLVKTPTVSTTYLIEAGHRRAFLSEEAFWSRRHDFADVALITDDELLDCYDAGFSFGSNYDINAVYDGSIVWLIEQDSGSGYRARREVPLASWQAVLKSWNITASTYDDLHSPSELGIDLDDYRHDLRPVLFRDGSLVRENSNSAVYFIADGIAMPIESWDVLLLMGFGNRDIIWVDDGIVSAIQQKVGSCSVNSYCLSLEDVTTCGGPNDDEGVIIQGGTDDDDINDDSELGNPDTGHNPPEDDDENDNLGDPGDTGTPAGLGQPPVADLLWLEWTTPAGSAADRITVSGEFTPAGGTPTSWQNLAEVHGAATVRYERAGTSAGDSLRFSVEYQSGGGVSWSCLAPFPPGTMQGSVAAGFGAASIDAIPTADPVSNGCGLTIVAP
ncbi:MAG: M23 family metallopeptidase [Patescibacteria group bacterium]